MHHVVLVALREIRVILRRKTFYLSAFGMPLFIGALFFGISWSGREAGIDAQEDLLENASKPAGFVDQSGVIRTIPPALGPLLQRFPDPSEAQSALQAGRIGSFFVIENNYLATGQVVRVSEQATMFSPAGGDVRLLTALLRANLTNDFALALRLDSPATFDTEIVGSTAEQDRGKNGEVTSIVAGGFAFLLALSLVTGGNLLLTAVAEEKSNRTIEVLLTSLKPWQLLTGKLLGLGVIGLLQLGIWLAISRLLLRGAGNFMPASNVGQVGTAAFPLSLWLWAILLFLLGYTLFGALMASVAALGTSPRESGQTAGFLTLPVLAPAWFLVTLNEQPDGTLARVLSFFPLTAPTTLMLRMGISTVPVWQLLLAILILAFSVVCALALAARLFRATTLLTGTKPTPRALLRALRSA